MEKCTKCGSVISDNDPMAWKCMECGKAFRVNLSKLKKLQILKNKPENAGKILLKCPTCGNGIDNGNEKIACKCSACGNVMMGKLRDFMNGDAPIHTAKNQIINIPDTMPDISKDFIKCSNCGNNVPGNSKFCPECGIQFSSLTVKQKEDLLCVYCMYFCMYFNGNFMRFNSINTKAKTIP